MHLPPGRWEEAEKLEQLRALEHGFAIHIVETDGDTREVDSPEDARQVESFSGDKSSGEGASIMSSEALARIGRHNSRLHGWEGVGGGGISGTIPRSFEYSF